jgi:hypothetical protein
LPAGRLYDVLVDHFSAEINDIDNVEPGEDFVERTLRWSDLVTYCSADRRAVANPTNGSVQRRLDNPENRVRLEIETG